MYVCYLSRRQPKADGLRAARCEVVHAMIGKMESLHMSLTSGAPTPPAHARRIVRGHVFTDFEPGRRFEHDQRKTVLESDNMLFTTLTMHYNPVYLDRERAVAAGFRDIAVNPLLVFNLIFGLSVEDLSEGGGPFLGIEALEYHAPVYAGDTLRGISTVASARLSSKHEHYAIVTWDTEGFNQHDEKVVSFRRSNLVRRAR
jgi:acyl dehydratase